MESHMCNQVFNWPWDEWAKDKTTPEVYPRRFLYLLSSLFFLLALSLASALLFDAHMIVIMLPSFLPLILFQIFFFSFFSQKDLSPCRAFCSITIYFPIPLRNRSSMKRYLLSSSWRGLGWWWGQVVRNSSISWTWDQLRGSQEHPFHSPEWARAIANAVGF